jgi:hypothetical protein
MLTCVTECEKHGSNRNHLEKCSDQSESMQMHRLANSGSSYTTDHLAGEVYKGKHYIRSVRADVLAEPILPLRRRPTLQLEVL